MRETSYSPVHSYLETGARRIGRIRRQTAGRMRTMRQHWRDIGRPDPATLDRAIVDALRDELLAAPEGARLSTPVDPEALLRGVARKLVERSQADREAGKEGVVYVMQEVVVGLQVRLLQRPKRA